MLQHIYVVGRFPRFRTKAQKEGVKVRTRRLQRFVVAIVAAFALAFAVTPALAANTSDEGYNFYFYGGGATQGTRPRPKTNTTPVYVRVDTITISSVGLYVDGAYSSRGPWTNRTNGGSAPMSQVRGPGRYSIHTSVYESGRRWARLTGYSSWPSGSVYGVWSPDSTRTYTSLN